MTWAVLASGQSLTQEQVNLVRLAKAVGVIEGVIAVSNVGLDLYPDADALVSHDINWWYAYPNSFEFEGAKYSAKEVGNKSVQQYKTSISSINSGLLAMLIARDIFKAKRLILLGFDMQGTHYFGKHPEAKNGRRLSNALPHVFDMHIKQFNSFSGCEVVNANPDSALNRFPKANLCDIIKL